LLLRPCQAIGQEKGPLYPIARDAGTYAPRLLAVLGLSGTEAHIHADAGAQVVQTDSRRPAVRVIVEAGTPDRQPLGTLNGLFPFYKKNGV